MVREPLLLLNQMDYGLLRGPIRVRYSLSEEGKNQIREVIGEDAVRHLMRHRQRAPLLVVTLFPVPLPCSAVTIPSVGLISYLTGE